MERAIAYCRVSDPRQVKDEGSLDRQAQEARDHAKRMGYDLMRIFFERGESAKTDDRTALKELLSFARTANANVLIVPKIDRLARNSYDYLTLKVTLGRFGTRIESVGENIEDTPVGRFLETVLSGTAQLDNEIRAERSRNGLIDAYRQGRWVWRAPFGYVHQNGNIVPKEPEASMVRTIFRLSRTLTPSQCYEEVKRLGFPLKRTRLYDILRDPVYAGRMNSFGMPIRGSFEALVPEHYLQMAPVPAVHNRENPDFPLKSVGRCCGQLTGSWSRGRSSIYPYYRCQGCRRNIAKEKLEGSFAQFLDTHALSPDGFAELSDHLNGRFEATQRAAMRTRAEAERRLHKVRALQQSLALKNASGVIPDEVAGEQIRRLMDEEAQLVASVPTATQSTEELLQFAQRALMTPGEFWRTSPHSIRLRFQHFLLPGGATFSRKLRFGTKKIRLLEPAKRLLEPLKFGMEHQTEAGLNQLITDLSEYSTAFEHGDCL